MKINLGNGISEQERTVKSGRTFVAQNLKRESEMLDKFGNVIDPRTKQIIRPAEKEQ